MKSTLIKNRIQEKISTKDNLLSIYFTAGFPQLQDTRKVISNLAEAGVDMIEIGLPYSDPIADGEVIQKSSTQALQNGMSTSLLFQQLKGIREEIEIPLIIMGYFNAMLQFGVEKFCRTCADLGIDGIIMPDLPVEVYEKDYKDIFEKYELNFICLITPQTSEERIRKIDQVSTGFIYMVSTASTTGKTSGFGPQEMDYFKRIKNMNLKNKCIVGFGIKDQKSFSQVCQYAKGGIIGSAFIQFLRENGTDKIDEFIQSIQFN